MLSAGFEPVILASMRRQTHTLDNRDRRILLLAMFKSLRRSTALVTGSTYQSIP